MAIRFNKYWAESIHFQVRPRLQITSWNCVCPTWTVNARSSNTELKIFQSPNFIKLSIFFLFKTFTAAHHHITSSSMSNNYWKLSIKVRNCWQILQIQDGGSLPVIWKKSSLLTSKITSVRMGENFINYTVSETNTSISQNIGNN